MINLHQIFPCSMRNSFSKTVQRKRGQPAYVKLNSASMNPCTSYWRDIIWQRLRLWLFTCLGFIRRTSSRKSMSSNPILKIWESYRKTGSWPQFSRDFDTKSRKIGIRTIRSLKVSVQTFWPKILNLKAGDKEETQCSSF